MALSIENHCLGNYLGSNIEKMPLEKCNSFHTEEKFDWIPNYYFNEKSLSWNYLVGKIEKMPLRIENPISFP